MAEQPKDSDKFSEYVNTYFKELTGSTGRKQTTPTPFPYVSGQKQKLGFLGRTVDILSRPMRIISNPVMKAVELPERMDKVQELRLSGQDEAATKEALSAAGSLIAAPFTGFFSDDPANKPYWSDIIERSTDVQNRNDPNYVDVANNADPVAKGVAGFIGDVLIDPLWLVPGGWGVKAAKEASKGVKTTAGISKASDVVRAVNAGEIPEAALTPSMSGIRSLSAVEPVLRQSEDAFDLISTVRGKQKVQSFANRDAAEQALRKSRAKDKRIVPKATTVADSFPAAQASQKLADDLAKSAAAGGTTASETVIKSLREIVNAKKVTVGGKQVGLRGEIASFFENLAKAAPAPKVKPGKPVSFAKWAEAASADKVVAASKIAVPEGSILAEPLGKAATVRATLDLYRNTRLPEIKREVERLLLRPAYDRYATGLKEGKGVDLLGNATTPTGRMQEAVEASVAATVVRNLKNLDDAERARGAALLGEGLFNDIQRFNPRQMTKFLDDIDAVLKETGAIDAIGPVGAQTLLGRVLGLFDSDPALRAAAEAQLSRSIDNIPNATPENVAARVVQSSRSADMTDLVTNLFRSRGITDNLANRVIAIKEAVAEVLPDLIKAKLDPKYQKAVYKYRKGEALKTEAEFGKGRAVIPKDPNSGFQAELVKDLQIALAKYYKPGADGRPFLGFPTGKEFKGDKFIREKERDTLIALELAEELLKQQGLAMTLKLNGVGYQITLSQAYRTLTEVMDSLPMTSRWLAGAAFNAFSPVGPKGVRKAAELFDGTLPFNVFADAVARRLSKEYTGVDDIKNILMSKFSAAGVPIVNGLADSAMAGRSIKVGPSSLSAKQMVDNIAEAIDQAGPAFATVVAKNVKEYAERGLVEGKQLTAEAAEIISDLFKSPEKVAAQIRVAAEPSKVVEDIAAVVPTTELGQTIAGGVITASIGPEVSKTAQAVENIVDGASVGDIAKVTKNQEDLIDNAAATAQRFLDDAARVAEDLRNAGNPYDEILDDVSDEFIIGASRPQDAAATQGRATVTAGALKFMDPLRRFFDSKYGMHTKEMLWGSRLFFAQGNLAAMMNKPFLQSLKRLAANNEYAVPVVPGGKTTVLQQAFKNVQAGVRSAEGTALRKAEDDIRPMMARFFDQTDEIQNILLGNAFFRTGAGKEAINAVMDFNGVLGRSNGLAKTPPSGTFFDQDLAVKTAAETAARAERAPTENDVLQAMFEQWKTWEVEDPIDFMYKVNRAMVQLSTEVSFVTAFRQKAAKLGLASSKPREGFVKIVPGEDSRYGKLLGDKPLYLDREVAEMFESIDNLAKSTKQFEGGFGKFVRTTLDPVTDTWKYAITLPRPGHHIRNMIGDMILTFLAEGTIGSAIATRKAWQMMALKGSYSDVDVARALTRIGANDVPKNTSVISSGKFGSFTADEVYRELFLDKGILIPARQREGLLSRQGLTRDDDVMADDFVESNRLSRGLEKGFAVASFGIAARGGRMEEAITGFAEGRDTFIRMQHAFQMLEKAQQGKKLTRGFGQVVDTTKISKEELYDLIAERVSKYHPDMATLSVQEKKYLRRIMPFYHWNRGAIQAVLETLVMNPGRVLALNKASYNIAVAAGINPDAMYDPFPDDQLFPSFLRDQMEGPQFEIDGKYYGFKPGITTFDVFNQFASGNPIDTVLDNANPALKIPIELMTGARLGTQSRIRDYSDYLDSSIPGLNYAANISGQSVTGSLYSLLTRGGFDPQYQFEVGNKDFRDQFISALNWVFGLGLTDYSRPSYIRIAEQEQNQQMEPGGDF